MKRTHLLVLSAAAAALQIGIAQASTFPADAEASYDLPALESYAERLARAGDTSGAEAWGVSRRHVEPFKPMFNAPFIDD